MQGAGLQKINTLIWDLGGVLIDWDPTYVFDEKYFPTLEDRDYFLNHVCTPAWNENQDAGYPLARATEEKIAAFPGWEKPVRDYYGRWEEMLKGPIQGTVDLFRLIKQNTALRSFAFTNWSAETFPVALRQFDFLQWFHGRLVSGEEKTRKPFSEFFALLVKRFSINIQTAFFIDDNLRNVKAAEEFGFRAIQFRNAPQLKEVFQELHIL